MGLSLSVTCAAEVVVFWYSGALIQRLGIRRCTHLVFAAFLLRLLCYATLAHWGSPWMVGGCQAGMHATLWWWLLCVGAWQV